jgi:exodeoxyribonuclease VII large subunit
MSAVFPPPTIKVFTVGELTRAVKGMLEENFTTVWVEGEVSNLSRPSSGHLYLTLKDEEAPLRAVIWRGVSLRMRFDLHDGMRVVVRGRLTLYAPQGNYQLQIEEVQPKGIGPLELAFRQLKEKLFTQGFFEPARKKKLPRIPRRVVLVTSPTGSAVRDMLEILSRRWPAAEVWVCPVKVQGDGAAQDIADAIRRVNKLHATGAVCIDVMIIGRGGGSLEDLWAFNEELVAQAIFASRIPVVSGVGHEDDLTIADLVADLRALTPSEAAEKVTPDRAAVLDWLEKQATRWRGLLLKQLESARARLDDLAGRRCFTAPLDRVRDEERRLDDWNDRLQRAMTQRLEAAQRRLESLAAQLASLSPLNILARGYTLTLQEADGAVVRSTHQVRRGDRLVTRVGDGRIVSRVEETTDGVGAGSPRPLPTATPSEPTPS